jgi:XRE family transcriptional regulator, aerobic/anaerobic benzoate catabolism transcriptional regulator
VADRDSGAEIGELLALGGQPAYRRHERRALEAAVSGNQAAVIAAGGGIVADGETYALLLESCHAIWLRARPDEHMARVVAQGDLRPMADNREAMADLEAILEARTPDYARADATLDTAGEAEDASFARLAALADRLAGGTVSPG